MTVSIEQVSLRFSKAKGGEEYVLKDFSLTIHDGELTCLLGPSGCGKSSLLGLIAGFVRPSHGKILVRDKKIHRPDINRTLVFQEYALFPWLNVIDNVSFGLRYSIQDKQERYMAAARYLKMVGLLEHARSSISQLSGGMKQRVALARALAVKPDLLLMDEPFGALDDHTRGSMQKELIRIRENLKPSVIFVTHSVDEALILADRIIIMARDKTQSEKGGVIKADIRIASARPRDLASQEMLKLRRQIQEALFSNMPKPSSDNNFTYDANI